MGHNKNNSANPNKQQGVSIRECQNKEKSFHPLAEDSDRGGGLETGPTMMTILVG